MIIRLVKDLLPFQGPILVGVAVDLLSGTDRSLYGLDLTPNDTRSIVIIAIGMGLLAIAKVVIGYMHTISSALLGRQMVEAARRDMAEATMQMTLDERRRFNSGDLLDRSLADSKGLRSFVQNVVIRLVSNTLRAIYPVTLMFLIDPIMALVVLAVIPLQSGFSGLLQRRLHRQTRAARMREAAHTSAVKESIDGWNSVISVGGQDWVTTELKASASAAEDAKIEKKHTTAQISAVINLCTSFGIAACYAIGGWRIINSGIIGNDTATISGALTLGTLTTFIGVAKKTYAPFQAYTKIVSSYRTGIVNLERISEVLDAPMQDPRPNGPVLNLTDGNIDIDDVSFRYDAEATRVLSGLTGRIPGRALTVISGPSGTGKTTLLRMLMGLDVPESGTISIDGQDINTARLSSVRSTMALVPQEPMLFTGTLGENLLFGNPSASTEKLLDACHKAGLLELVRELPKGLDTDVGSGRHMLSGGQLRRMAIARALLRNPGVLLLDEPTTGLDQLRSEQVLDTLRSISAETTVIMVSHRRDPLAASDHHFILADGSWTAGAAGPATAVRHGAEPLASTIDGSDHSTYARVTEPLSSPAASHAAVAANGAVGAVATNGAGQVAARAVAAANAPSVPARIGTHVGHRVIGLSAMGRAITLNSIDRDNTTTSLVLVGGHRAEIDHLRDFAPRFLAAVAPIDSIAVGLAAIDNLNPDGAWTDDGRTVLGIDPSADHHRRAATETLLLHRTVAEHSAALVIDVGHDPRPSDGSADVRVTIRHGSNSESVAWLGQLASDVERRLAVSRFSFDVKLEACAADSLTAALGVPVIELTAINAPSGHQDERVTTALGEVGLAIYRSSGLSQPTLARP